MASSQFPIITKYSTLKTYKENYEKDLLIYLEDDEDNKEKYYLEKDLLAHKEYLEHLQTKEIEIEDFGIQGVDETWEEHKTKIEIIILRHERKGKINEQKINRNKNIIEFIEQRISELGTEIPKIAKPKPNKSLLFEGKNLNLSERYKIANKVINIEKQIRKLNIKELEKHQLLAYILGCDITTARNLYNGTYNSKDRDLSNFFNELDLNE
jgi:hypothetical protein